MPKGLQTDLQAGPQADPQTASFSSSTYELANTVTIVYKGNKRVFNLVFSEANNQASVWYYFWKENTGLAGLCMRCKDSHSVISASHRSTSGMRKHILSEHKINLDDFKLPSQIRQDKTKKIHSYFGSTTCEETIARLAAKDGITFRQIASSVDIRKGLEARGFKDVPTSVHGVVSKIKVYYQKVTNSFKNEIKEVQQQSKFAIVFDEWTSLRGRRYINITLISQKKIWNLGLIRIIGRATSVNCLDLVQFKLEAFGLTLKKDIVAVITDGCNVMKSIGTMIKPVHQQLCFAHAIQLAVVKTLYLTPTRKSTSYLNDKETESEVDELSENVDGDLRNEENANDEDDEEEENDEDGAISFPKAKTAKVNPMFSHLTSKVRSIVTAIRKSPVRREKLQQYCLSELHRSLEPLIDCKTRWNSLCDMLERFYILRNCIKKVYIDEALEFDINNEELKTINDISKALSPVKATVEMLCRRETNLIQADSALNYLLEYLKKQNSVIAISIHESLIKNIRERRTSLSDVLKYLHTKEVKSSIHKSLNIEPITKSTLSKIIIQIAKKPQEDELFDFSGDEVESTDCDESPRKKQKSATDFAQGLSDAISESMQCALDEKQTNNPDDDEIILTELQLFEKSEKKQFNLEFVYNSILSVPGTSVESERAFSAAGYFCNKFRSNFSDQTLDMVCTLRSYFQTNNLKC